MTCEAHQRSVEHFEGYADGYHAAKVESSMAVRDAIRHLEQQLVIYHQIMVTIYLTKSSRARYDAPAVWRRV